MLKFNSPRSISALKCAADRLQAADPSLKRQKSLDRAAGQAGYVNWLHACNHLPDRMPALSLECRWRAEPTARAVQAERLSYPMPWDVQQVLAARYRAGRIAEFNFAASSDRLVCRSTADGQNMARNWIDQALRELLVIEVTGLIPSPNMVRAYPTARAQFQGIPYLDPIKPPGADHLSIWFDSKTRRTVLFDEPYRDRERGPRHPARQKWCSQHGFTQLQSKWGGAHNAPDSELFLLTRSNSGIDLSDIERRLVQLPNDFGSSPGLWRGETVDVFPRLAAHRVRQIPGGL